MDVAVLVGRLVLATVFAVAAVTKLRDRHGTMTAIVGLGASRRHARPLARILPVVELAVALGLLIEPVVVAAAVGALVLLAVFTGAIVTALLDSRRPDCGCFGNLSMQPVGWNTVARNAGLAAVALLVALGAPGASLFLPIGLVVVGAATAGIVRLGAARVDAVALVPARPTTPPDWRGLPLGTPAPAFELTGPCTGTRSLGALCAGDLPVVLLFLDAGCGSCRELHPHLNRWQVALGERVKIAVVMTGDSEAARALCSEHHVQDVLVDDGEEPLWNAYLMPGTPSGVAVAPDGRIASGPARGPDALEELVRQTVRSNPEAAETWKQPTPVS